MKLNSALSFITLLLVLITPVTQAANIKATLDRNPVMLDESFRLVLESDGSVDESPDLSPLKKDFEVLSHSHSQNMTFINGQLERKSVWNIVLMGKNPGTFTIPEIPFGNDRSPALRIVVKEATVDANPAAGGSEIYAEIEVDQKNPWIQSQVIYTVRLFTRLALSNLRPVTDVPSTSDPDAIIKQLGKPKDYESLRGGVRFAVREYRFAIYPQHSGKLTISPMVFEGRLSRNRKQSIFDQFMNTGELRRIRSKGLILQVKAKPGNIKSSEWLPASKLSLTEEWSEDVSKLKSGEPVTRTIKLVADGPLAANLPDISLPEAENIKQYPDKPVFEDRVTEKGVTSTKQIKVAMIPTRGGEYKLPAISVPWWNTRKGRSEIARLPEIILKATGVVENAAPPPLPITEPAQPADSQEKATATISDALPVKDSYWPWISLALAAGWLITLIAYFSKQGTAPRKKAEKPAPAPALSPLEKNISKYCAQNNAAKTKTALIEWARARWPDRAIASLVDIAELTDSATSDQIQALNAVLYSASHEKWKGGQLAKAFDNFRRQKIKPDNVSEKALKPLYKAAS